MAHRIHASVVLPLPDGEPKEWISALSVVASAWSAFLAAVEPLRGVPEFTLIETKGAAGNGVKRTRRRRNAEGQLVDAPTVPVDSLS